MAVKDSKPTPLTAAQKQAVVRLDAILVAMVLMLSFLLGSTAVKNSDFWMHLATGRAIVSGTYFPGGDDPFSYTTAGATWVNHSWLYDLATYFGYQLLGGTSLVVVKALGVLAIAVVLLQLRRPEQSLWIPAACTGLAMLALSPRLSFQPSLISFLFLALTHLILDKTRTTRWLWLLVPLFVLWVNLDNWFFLGPITAGLFLVGEWANGVRLPPEKRPSLRPLMIVTAAAIGACVLNPHTVFAFTTLPVEVSFAGYAVTLQSNPTSPLGWLFYSPLQPEYLMSARMGLSVAGWSYLVLLLVGVVSFGVDWKNINGSRLLIFLAFASLALWRAQAVPFFAVVAGPIAALNFQDFVPRRAAQAAEQTKLDWPAFLKGLGLITAVLAVAAVVAKTSLVSTLIDALIKASMGVEGVAATLGLPDPSIPFLIFAVLTSALFLFAVGPILRYLSDALVSWPLGGRLLTVIGVLILLVMVWPGWLQVGGFASDPQQARRVDWVVEPDPSMVQVCQRLAEWRDNGWLPADAKGFHTQPQMANYFAWFNPEQKGFYDHRYALFADVTEPYLTMRKILGSDDLLSLTSLARSENAGTALEADQKLADLEATFRDQGVRYAVLTGLDTKGALGVVRNAIILEEKRQAWKLLYLDGKSVILGWNDPSAGRPDPLQPAYLDAERLAFAPARVDPSVAERVPTTAPPAFDLTRYMNPPRPRLLETDEALMQLFYFEGVDRMQVRQIELNQIYRVGCCGGLVGVAAGATAACPSGPAGLADRLSAAWLLSFRGDLTSLYFARPPAAPKPTVGAQVLAVAGLEGFIRETVFDDRSPGPLYLGIRAARKSLANNPEDALSYVRLSLLYQTLSSQTRERRWNLVGAMTSRQVMNEFNLRGGTTLSPMVMQELNLMRQVQTVAALRQAETLDPNNPETLQALANYFQQQGFRDLPVMYRKRYLDQVRLAGPPDDAKAEAFEEGLKKQEADLEAETRQLEKLQNDYQKQLQAARSPTSRERALLARQLGLADEMQNVLDAVLTEKADLATLRSLFQLTMDLYLLTGRVDLMTARFCGPDRRFKEELRNKLGPAEFATLTGVSAEAWYGWLLAAAIGDAAAADLNLKRLFEEVDPRVLIGSALGNILMEQSTTNPLTRLGRLLSVPAAGQQIQTARGAIQMQLNLLTLRGLMAVEAGDTIAARQHFEEALRVAVPPVRYTPFLLELGPQGPLENLNSAAMVNLAAAGPIHFYEGRAATLYYLDLLERAAR